MIVHFALIEDYSTAVEILVDASIIAMYTTKEMHVVYASALIDYAVHARCAVAKYHAQSL